MLSLLLVLPSIGSQTLQPATIPLAGEPRAPVAADLDGDSDLDIVVAQTELHRVAVLLRREDGTYSPGGVHATGRAPVSLAAGDVNGDGNVDLAVANEESVEATLLLGDGRGSFRAGVPPPVPMAHAVELADLDGDGRVDLAFALSGGRLRLLEGAGDGTFSEAGELTLDGAIANFTLAKVDGDDLLDVVAAAMYEGPLLLLNQGSFAFDESVIPTTFGPACRWVAVADVDENETADVAFVESDAFDTCPSVRLGNGDGTFGTYAPIEIDALPFERVAFARIDGDTDPDAVSISPNGIHVRFGARGPYFSSETELYLMGQVSGLIAADLDGDGPEELVATSAAAGELVVYSNTLCQAAPFVGSVTPTQVPALASPPVQLAVSGCGLDAVTGVAVAGATLSTGDFTVEGTTSLLVDMPPATELGATSVVLSSAGGEVAATVEYVAPEPVLALGGGALGCEPTPLLVGAAPGDSALLFASPALASSSAPGLVELDIGDGFTSLFFLGATVLPPPAWTQHELPVVSLPPGLQIHFQGAVLAAKGPALRLATTNVATGTVVAPCPGQESSPTAQPQAR